MYQNYNLYYNIRSVLDTYEYMGLVNYARHAYITGDLRGRIEPAGRSNISQVARPVAAALAP